MSYRAKTKRYTRQQEKANFRFVDGLIIILLSCLIFLLVPVMYGGQELAVQVVDFSKTKLFGYLSMIWFMLLMCSLLFKFFTRKP